MKYTLPSLALASIASARALYPRDSCCFGIQVSGSTVNGTLGQLSDGQNRVGPQGQSGASYCLNGGKITDNSGRGCVVTSADQFQCDQDASPTGGFSLSSSGELSYQSSSTFWACPADDNGDYNIYTNAITNMPKCVQIGLSSTNGSCATSSSSVGTAAPVTAVSSSAAPVATSNASATCEASTVVSTLPPQTQTVTQYITQQNNVSVPGPTQYQTQVSQTTDTAYQTETDTAVSTEEQTVAGPTSTVLKTVEQTTTNWKTEEQTTTVTQSVTESAAPVTVTVTQSASPVTQVVTQSASPVTEEVTESATQYITQSASPVTEEITESATQYITQSASPVTEEVTQTVSPVTEQVTQTASPTTEQTTESATQYVTTSAPATTTAQASASIPTYSNSTTSASGSSSTCPGNLPDMSNYQAPRLIIPVNSNSPNTTYGTQYNAYIGGGNSTIFNFDIPSNYTGKQCTVILTLPTNDQLETSFVKSSGSGGIDFKQLDSAVTKSTSYSNVPGVSQDFGNQDITVGNAYTVTSGDCQTDSTLTYELSATGDFELEYFQDYNPCPIGLWVYSS